MRISDWSSDVCSSDLKSQGAEGSLAAQQATNQLLALATKQQFQLQNLMAAQFRTDSIAAARRTQSAREARARTTRSLGDGQAYTPPRSEEHTSELQFIMRISYAVFCLQKKNLSIVT